MLPAITFFAKIKEVKKKTMCRETICESPQSISCDELTN